ncbi:ArsR/SmtB family transcription factor [Melghirimyces algeriensis]|uniref:Transcriptional regulator, ArsR family n=1 Tax=Melghirimyces algeriensis TaxID=910412 RepID=A0A521DL25_9BACL|nr:metalloregulator ArsR/SmtB family transcription factor [Melghirimyces algeriensis]SMO71801.1 transcriptional regulator, ArsR family [Melghirimyces algeriensis]
MSCCTNEPLSQIARALADPIRCQILDLIAGGDGKKSVQCCTTGMCVCDIQEALNLKQSKVSYHVKELKNAGLLHERKRGKWNYYSINRNKLNDFCNELSQRFSLSEEKAGS